MIANFSSKSGNPVATTFGKRFRQCLIVLVLTSTHVLSQEKNNPVQNTLDSNTDNSAGLAQYRNIDFADAHIHFNWDQKEIISAADIVQTLKQHHVKLTIVAGTPTQLALELRQAGADWIIPFFSPYTHELGKRDWYKNKQLASLLEQGLKQGLYHGVGEVHFMAGFPPRIDNPVFVHMLALAKQYQVPSLIHIDAADASLFIELCTTYRNQKLIFAHAGGNLGPGQIKPVLDNCPNSWIDLAARDPWRYGGLTDDSGRLLKSWRELILAYPQRFITGTDPVWRVTRTQSWDQADDGWDHYHQLYRFHQNWLDTLPDGVASNIRWHNVQRLLERKSSPATVD